MTAYSVLRRLLVLAGAVCLAPLAGCGIDTAFNNALNPPVASKNPVAILDPESAQVRIGSVVAIDGSYSYDPQDKALTYAWEITSKPNGSAATLSSATASAVSFTADKGGYYTVILTATNVDALVSNVATALIDAVGTGDNHPPVASAGADQTVTTGKVAVLDGSGSYDPDGGNISYSWSLLRAPAASSVTGITDNNTSQALLYPDVAGVYTVRLSVTDGIDTDTDVAVVTATGSSLNTPPTADAGADQTVTAGLVAILDGGASSDPEGVTLSYSWSVAQAPTGSAVTSLTYASSQKALLYTDVTGIYTIKLTVSDGVYADDDYVKVTAN